MMVEAIKRGGLVVVVNWSSKKIVGHDAGSQAKMLHWLTALDREGQRQVLHGSQAHALHLRSDNGCQPTSVAFLTACATLGIAQAFTRNNNPKGNALTEQLVRMLAEALLWLRA